LVTGRAFGEFLIDSFDELVSEGGLHPRMMSVGMHARILGHPARIRGLQDFLAHIRDRDDVWVCRRGDLAAHWRTVAPPREFSG
jgi:peptidoglycan/xylan/chitin deacetylase (PgdA/CDA1 family)